MNLDRKLARGLNGFMRGLKPVAFSEWSVPAGCAAGGRRVAGLRSTTRIRRPSEDGFTMVVAIFLLAIFTLAMAVAAPEMAKQIQLDREHETMERGKQYVRAVQLYYRKFHAYPPSIDALVNTDNIRFLRQKYKDPLTGKSDWRIIHFGQAKTQSLGFFGQPIMGAGMAGGSVIAGVGPSGGNTPMQNGGLGSASPFGGGSDFGGGSSLGGSSGLGGGVGSSLGGSSGSPFTSSPLGSNDSGNTGGTQNGMNGVTGPAGASGTNGTSGTSGMSTSSAGNGNGNGLGSGTGLGSGDQTFGGAGIIGVAPASKKQSIMIFKKKDHYNEWEFVYDPLTDIRTMGGSSGPGGVPAGGNPDQNGGSPNGFGTNPSGNGFGGSIGSGPSSGMGGGPGMGGGSGSGGFGGSGFGGSGFGGNGPGGSSPTPQPQQQVSPEQQ